jgi:hypothetical protein
LETRDRSIVEEFANVARKYIKWADIWGGTPEENALTALRFLPELYLAAMALPDIPPGSPDNDFDLHRHQAQWQALRLKFQSLPIDGYLKIFSPLKQEKEPVKCSLSDDLADIYLDLEKGLTPFAKGDINEAIWQWRFLFWNHWGRHLTGALSALHSFQSFDY